MKKYQAISILHVRKHIAESYPSVVKIAALPITLPILAYRILSGKQTIDDGNITNFPYHNGKGEIRRNSIVFFPTNGVGFGHFTRTLAIARRLKKIDSSLEIVFITTMPTPPLSDEGFLTYHLPSQVWVRGHGAQSLELVD